MEIIKRNNDSINLGGCDNALLIYGAPKPSTVYVVKWAFLGLQRTSENSVLAPSSQDLLALGQLIGTILGPHYV